MKRILLLAAALACGEAGLAPAIDDSEVTGKDVSGAQDTGTPGAGDGADGSTDQDTVETPDASDGPDGGDGGEGSDGEPDALDVLAIEEVGTTDLGLDGDAGAPPDEGSEPDTSATAPTDPGQVGPHAFSTTPGEIVLEPGPFGAKIALTIVTPNGATDRPVVVFTHGFQLSPADYDATAEHLATWGYVVILPNLGTSFSATHVQQKDKLLKVLDWIETESKAASGPLAGVADPSRIVMAGHSMGGKLAFFVAAEDARAVAVFGLDPVDAAGGPIPLDAADYPSIAPERLPDIDVPFVVVGETTNSAPGALGVPCAPAAENFHQYFAGAASPAAEFEFVGAWHMSWLDEITFGCFACLACDKGTADDGVVRSLTRRYFVAFLKSFVDGELAYRTWLDGAAAEADVAAGVVKRSTKNGF